MATIYTLEAEAEREERERLQKIRSREEMAFLAYLKIRMDEEKAKEAHERFVTNLQKDFFHQYFQQALALNRAVLEGLVRHDALIFNFLISRESEEEKTQREELMQKLNLDAADYSAVAVADLSRKQEDKEELEKVFQGEQPTERLHARRRLSIIHTNEALLDLSSGNIEKIESILKDGLLNACHAFTQTGDPLKAIHWSRQINGILSVISSHPMLFKDSSSTPMLEAATGMAALGRVMENGLKALDELQSARLNGVKLPSEREMNLQAEILLMQQTDERRSNEQYRKFFARGYHPKTGLKQENLKNLLRQLNSSQAIYTLSAMNPDEKLFMLSDRDSCRSLSMSLFVAHTEKHSAAPEKTSENKAPSALR